MQKFTVFTVILTILVVVVAAETFVNKYLPALTGDDVAMTEEGAGDQYNLPSELDLSAAIGANVLGADGSVGGVAVSESPAGIVDGVGQSQDIGQALDFLEVSGGDSSAIEDPLAVSGDSSGGYSEYLDVSGGGYFDLEDFSGTYDTSTVTVYLRDDQIANSGFVGAYLEPEDFDGFLYKTVTVGDLQGVDVEKYAITNSSTVFAKVYVILMDGEEANVADIYNVLKVRASEGLEAEINETNDYGSSSFYMNDARRENVAFLTVRIGSRIYGFSYPKQYHPQLKNLVSILMLDSR